MEMSHKGVFQVREPLVLINDQEISENSEISTWCCCSQGTSSLKCKFDKNIFHPQEEA